jgi:hypothetical protein
MDPRFLSFSLVVVALFSFLSVMMWSRERRREREAYYWNEALKKVAEMHQADSGIVLDMLREDGLRRAGDGRGRRSVDWSPSRPASA